MPAGDAAREKLLHQRRLEPPRRRELFAEIRPIEKVIREIKEQIGKLAMIQSLLIETLGFSMADELHLP
jgi:hypothetical protein